MANTFKSIESFSNTENKKKQDQRSLSTGAPFYCLSTRTIFLLKRFPDSICSLLFPSINAQIYLGGFFLVWIIRKRLIGFESAVKQKLTESVYFKTNETVLFPNVFSSIFSLLLSKILPFLLTLVGRCRGKIINT